MCIGVHASYSLNSHLLTLGSLLHLYYGSNADLGQKWCRWLPLHSAFLKAHYSCKNALVTFSITARAHLHATWVAHSDPLVFHGKRQKENCNLKTKRKLKEINIFYLSLNFDFPFVSYKYLFESLFGSPSALSCQGFHTYWHLFYYQETNKKLRLRDKQKTEMNNHFLFHHCSRPPSCNLGGLFRSISFLS